MFMRSQHKNINTEMLIIMLNDLTAKTSIKSKSLRFNR